jgi:hypothetical protein
MSGRRRRHSRHHARLGQSRRPSLSVPHRRGMRRRAFVRDKVAHPRRLLHASRRCPDDVAEAGKGIPFGEREVRR